MLPLAALTGAKLSKFVLNNSGVATGVPGCAGAHQTELAHPKLWGTK